MSRSTVRIGGIAALTLVGSLILAAPAAYADDCQVLPSDDAVTTIVHPAVVRTVPALTHAEWVWERTVTVTQVEYVAATTTTEDTPAGERWRETSRRETGPASGSLWGSEVPAGFVPTGAVRVVEVHEQSPGTSAVPPTGAGWTALAASEVLVTDAAAHDEVVEDAWVEYLLSPPQVSEDCAAGVEAPSAVADEAPPAAQTPVPQAADAGAEVAPVPDRGARTSAAAASLPAAGTAVAVADTLVPVASVQASPPVSTVPSSAAGWLGVLGFTALAGLGAALGVRRRAVR